MAPFVAPQKRGAYFAYSVNGHQVGVWSELENVLVRSNLIFGECLLTPGPLPGVPTYLVYAGRSGVVVSIDDAAPVEFSTREDAAEYVQWHATQTALSRVDGAVSIHAAGVAHRGRAVIIAGKSGGARAP